MAAARPRHEARRAPMIYKPQQLVWIDILPGVSVGIVQSLSLAPSAPPHGGCLLCWVLLCGLQALLLGPAWTLGCNRSLSPAVAPFALLGKLVTAALGLAVLGSYGPADRPTVAASLLGMASLPLCIFCGARRRTDPPLPTGTL